MTGHESPVWPLLVAAVLAGMFGFWTWSVVRQRLLFDLHKIPSPPRWPLLGNLAGAIGPAASKAHQVKF